MTTPTPPTYDDRIAELRKRAGFSHGIGTGKLFDEALALASELAEKLKEAEVTHSNARLEFVWDGALDLSDEQRAHASTKRELEQERQLGQATALTADNVVAERERLKAELEQERGRSTKALDLLRHGQRACICIDCHHVFTSDEEYTEWQHDGCGGRVMELVERKPLLDALTPPKPLDLSHLEKLSTEPPPVPPVAAEEHVEFRECSSGDGGTHVFLSEARDARCELCGMLHEKAFPEELGHCPTCGGTYVKEGTGRKATTGDK